MKDFNIVPATANDGALMWQFMKKLGAYQKMSDHITSSPEKLAALIEEGEARALIGYMDHTPVAFMFYYPCFSAFIGEKGYYIDALYIEEELRHHHLGEKLMSHLAQIAQKSGYKRIEWGCLDWNQDALDFYAHYGAKGVHDMTIYRIHEVEIEKLASRHS